MLRYPDPKPFTKKGLELMRQIDELNARRAAAEKGEPPPEKALAKPLSRLEELDLIIKPGAKTFIEVGLALIEAHDNELYKEQGYGSFEECCEIRWDLKKSHVYRLMGASKAAMTLPEKERPKTEGAMRKSLTANKSISPVGKKSPKPPPDFEATLRRVMPVDTEPEEEDLLDEIITRIRRAGRNQDFLRALKEWLDESGI